MVVDVAPAHAPAAAAGTAPGAKPSTASEGLLARLAASGGAFTADDITFSVRTMLDENDHALPGSLAALKSIAKEIGVVREGLTRGEPPPDKLHRTIKACLMASSGAARDAMLAALELDASERSPTRRQPRKAILTPRTMARLTAACVQERRAHFSPRALKYWTPVGRVPPRRVASRFGPVSRACAGNCEPPRAPRDSKRSSASPRQPPRHDVVALVRLCAL
jgi:hypothetical protein